MTDKTKILGATSGDDTSGLIQRQLTDRHTRNAAELDAISRAYNKHIYRARRKGAGTAWLTDQFIRAVHYDMLGEIWEWAGKYRTGSLNIGVDFHLIPEQIKLLCDDFSYWNSDKSKMSPLEIAARLQNRLTRIHPYTNGNGRHARLITDIFGS